MKALVGREGAVIHGKPSNKSFVEQVIFTGGIHSAFKVKILQIKYMFPESFSWQELSDRFDVSRRTAFRWIRRMKDMGLVRYKYKADQDTRYARYQIIEDWR